MGRVNFAKGNWVFLSCPSWGREQIHEEGLKLLLFALPLEEGIVEIGSKKIQTPAAVPQKCPFH